MSTFQLPSPVKSYASHGPPSPTTSMRTKPSTTSLHANVNLSNQNHVQNAPLPYSALPTPYPPQDRTTNSNTDVKSLQQDSSREPKIFPGILHERTRRNSVRQGSTSENDMEVSTGNLVAMSRMSVKEESGEDSEGDLL